MDKKYLENLIQTLRNFNEACGDVASNASCYNHCDNDEEGSILIYKTENLIELANAAKEAVQIKEFNGEMYSKLAYFVYDNIVLYTYIREREVSRIE